MSKLYDLLHPQSLNPPIRFSQSRLKGSQNFKEIKILLTNSMDDRFSTLESNQFDLLSPNRASVQELGSLISKRIHRVKAPFHSTERDASTAAEEIFRSNAKTVSINPTRIDLHDLEWLDSALL
ncbi:hypothetical protein PCASD_05367 [Puccinia coronata f. sp. avenae]|uniref:Uncharacterized protein n=1 Tax=Puccinia coronata f. sp. avenae TaxID=200324 RepID=A0A2N5UNN7_9BASI|nr:hypothetical protein PCASD_05367 [Puccinia coronata f. sp. avenae]